MHINFIPEYDDPKLELAAAEYEQIWKSEGRLISKTISDYSGMNFVENTINAVVFEGRSHSKPLSLRASHSTQEKKLTLVHELCHRMCMGRVRVPFEGINKLEQAHRIIFLILYDVLCSIYGKDVADASVKVESTISQEYKDAWVYALSMGKDDRSAMFRSLIR